MQKLSLYDPLRYFLAETVLNTTSGLKRNECPAPQTGGASMSERWDPIVIYDNIIYAAILLVIICPMIYNLELEKFGISISMNNSPFGRNVVVRARNHRKLSSTYTVSRKRGEQ